MEKREKDRDGWFKTRKPLLRSDPWMATGTIMKIIRSRYIKPEKLKIVLVLSKSSQLAIL